MKLTGYPRPVPREDYARAIEHVLRPLRAEPAVQAVYQVGGIRTPGISDVDLLVVFRDDAECRLDPRAGLSARELYLFPHSQFGLPARHFAGAIRFGFFHDYRLLHGQEQAAGGAALAAAEAAAVNRQAGLEYLLKMFISMSVERAYGIARVRNLLLLGRALLYDLEYVGAAGSGVGRLVERVIEWREQWFTAPPAAAEIRRWFEEMYRELEALLADLLGRLPLFAPAWASLAIAGNMRIVPAAHLAVVHRGRRLPPALGSLGRRYFNIQHRFNRFEFRLPVTGEAPAAVRQRHELVAAMGEYNRARLPAFNAAPMALDIFRRREAA